MITECNKTNDTMVVVTTDDDSILYKVFGWLGNMIIIIKIIPQIIKIIKTKSAKDISLIFIILGIVGGACSISYGFMLNEYPIIIRSIIVTIQVIITLILKLYYDKRQAELQQAQQAQQAQQTQQTQQAQQAVIRITL